jgi:hypothetical protein
LTEYYIYDIIQVVNLKSIFPFFFPVREHIGSVVCPLSEEERGDCMSDGEGHKPSFIQKLIVLGCDGNLLYAPADYVLKRLWGYLKAKIMRIKKED